MVARSKLIVLSRSIFLSFAFASLTKLYSLVVATSLLFHDAAKLALQACSN